LYVFRLVADHIHAEQFCRTAVRFVFRAAAERRDRLSVGRARRADGRGRTTAATQSPATAPAQWSVGAPVAEFPGDVRRLGRRVQNGRGLRSADHCGGRGDHDRISRLSSTTPPPPSPSSPTAAAAAAAASSPATATAGSSPALAPTPCPTPAAAATQRAATPAPPSSRSAGPGPAAHTFRLSFSTLSRRVASAVSAAARFTDRRSRRHSVRVRTHVGSRGWHVAQATPSTASPPSPTTTTTTPSTTAATATTTRRGRCQSPAPPSTATTTTVYASASAAADDAADGHVSDD